jgi:hypothetical protein
MTRHFIPLPRSAVISPTHTTPGLRRSHAYQGALSFVLAETPAIEKGQLVLPSKPGLGEVRREGGVELSGGVSCYSSCGAKARHPRPVSTN